METRIAELESNVTQFIRLMMFVCAIVLYGDVLAPVVRIARAGEVLPLQTAVVAPLHLDLEHGTQ